MATYRKDPIALIGSSSSPLTLTGSYQASDPLFAGGADQLGLDIAYTMGGSETGNSIEIKVEFSNNSNLDTPSTGDWFREVTESVNSGTVTESLAERTLSAVSAAGTYDKFHLSIPIDAKWVRVSVKETGIAANGGSCYVYGVLTVQQ